MTIEEFKSLYQYNIEKKPFEQLVDNFKQIYCCKKGLTEYPIETLQIKHEKYKYIDIEFKKYQELIFPTIKQKKSFSERFDDSLKEWWSSINKKMNEDV